jgi:hypothetical protein
MRRLFLKIASSIAVLAVLSSLWIFLARYASLLIDRIATVKIESCRIHHVAFEGGEAGGTFKFAGFDLGTQSADNKPPVLSFGGNASGQFTLSVRQKTFPFGPFSMDGATVHFSPALGDKASLEVRRSLLSWPTPFEVNFMTGYSSSWRRNLYYELRWEKASGEKLAMVWRYEQYFYPRDGWTSGFMTHAGATGLLRVKISR